MSTVDYNPNEKNVRTYLDFTDEERRVFAKSVERRNFTHWSVSGKRVYAHVYVIVVTSLQHHLIKPQHIKRHLCYS